MSTTAIDKVLVTMNGRTAEVPRGTTILNAARQMGITIPTLCNYRGLTPYGACRVCLVEIETPRGGQLVASCSHPLDNDLVVHTDTESVKEARQTVLELLLAQAPDSTELAAFAAELGVKSSAFQPAADGSCILCGLCTRVCNEMMGRGAINLFGRGNIARSAHRFRRNHRPVSGLRGLRICMSDRLSEFRHNHIAPHKTASDGIRQAPGRPALHRSGPSPSITPRAGDRPRELHPFSHR